VTFDLSQITEPSQLTLTVRINKTDAVNQWNFWVYPKTTEDIIGKPYFTTDFHNAVAHAKTGKNVLYCLPGNALKADKGSDIMVGFSSVFWNTAWTRKQAPHTLGVLCNPAHPVLAAFPNKGHSDFQWWDVITGSSAMVMTDFPADFRPLVHIIDDWFTNRKLGLLFETKVGEGKLMVCSADLDKNLDKRPAARQFRYSIEKYMASDQFNPSTEVNLNIIEALLK
jgi:hypothetical protein